MSAPAWPGRSSSRPASAPRPRRPASPPETAAPAGWRAALHAAAALLLLAPADAGSLPHRQITYPEGEPARILTLPAGEWQGPGPDADRLRTTARPDFAAPADADGEGRWQVTATAGADTMPLTVRVEDRGEPGPAVLRPHRPVIGEPVTVQMHDPDGAAAPAVAWQRWQRPGSWQAIEGATGPVYTPGPADAGRPLRAVLSHAGRPVTTPPVIGPQLRSLAARTDSGRAAPDGAAMHPPFDPRILHYRIGCAGPDVMTVSFDAPPGVRVSVNGIQPAPGPAGAAALPVGPVSDVAVMLAAPDGAYTTYTIHCMPPELLALTTIPDPSRPLGVLLAITRGPWAAIIDEHGVARAHRRAEGESAGFFLRPFGAGARLRWAHVEQDPQTGRRWRVLDRHFQPLGAISTAAPLTTTGRHDFRLMEDGSALLMAYEPAVRDLRGLSFTDRDGQPFGAAVAMQDSAIQLLGPDGAVRWSWSSWGRLPPEDCTQHRFPGDWAHVNSVEWTDEGVLASFRGCSSILMLDPQAPDGEEIVWRLGASNLAADDWARRGLGPAPLDIIGDPEGEFCGQHAARLLPPPPGLSLPRLLIFDNGVACVTDPHTGEPLGRQPDIYSRAVEYALDPEHGEAVFVADHALGGRRDMLGHAGGHVAPLPGGDWLVSWGGPGRAAPGGTGGKPLTDGVTRVSPGTGEESFRIPATGGRGIRALPASLLSTMRAPGRLDAVLPDAPPAGHGGAGDRMEIAVAFSRPVAAFGPETGSVMVSGGALASVAPLAGFGRPAHAWRLVLAPAGDGPLDLRFRAGVACDGPPDRAPGICTADGERLRGVPDALAIPRIADEAAARDRTADAGHETRDEKNEQE